MAGCADDEPDLKCPAGQVVRNDRCACPADEQLVDGACTHIEGRVPRIMTSVVDAGGNTGHDLSLAMDPNNYPHLSYRESNNHDLRYATVAKDTGKWKVENVDVTGDVGMGTAIGLYVDGSDVRPVIAYRDETQHSLKGAFKGPKGWVKMFLDPQQADPALNRGAYPSIAVHNSADAHIAHIAYLDPSGADLYYLRWDLERTQEASRPVLVDPGFSEVGGQIYGSGIIGHYTSIALSTAGDPVIAYRDENNGDLKVGVYSSANDEWAITFVDNDPLTQIQQDDVGRFASVAVDSIDNYHVAYYDVTGAQLKYAEFDGSDWIIEVVDRGQVGKYASLAVRKDRSPLVSYYDETIGGIKVAHKRRDGTWQIEMATQFGISGFYNRLGLTDIGSPAVAYREYYSQATYFQFVDSVFP
jgi:hypothetical protein